MNKSILALTLLISPIISAADYSQVCSEFEVKKTFSRMLEREMQNVHVSSADQMRQKLERIERKLNTITSQRTTDYEMDTFFGADIIKLRDGTKLSRAHGYKLQQFCESKLEIELAQHYLDYEVPNYKKRIANDLNEKLAKKNAKKQAIIDARNAEKEAEQARQVAYAEQTAKRLDARRVKQAEAYKKEQAAKILEVDKINNKLAVIKKQLSGMQPEYYSVLSKKNKSYAEKMAARINLTKYKNDKGIQYINFVVRSGSTSGTEYYGYVEGVAFISADREAVFITSDRLGAGAASGMYVKLSDREQLNSSNTWEFLAVYKKVSSASKEAKVINNLEIKLQQLEDADRVAGTKFFAVESKKNTLDANINDLQKRLKNLK